MYILTLMKGGGSDGVRRSRREGGDLQPPEARALYRETFGSRGCKGKGGRSNGGRQVSSERGSASPERGGGIS